MSHYLFIALALLQAADVYTTLRILEAGGYERNRIVRWLMAEFGVTAALVLSKVLMLILVLVYLEQLQWWFMPAACLYYAGFVVNNVRVLKWHID